LRPSKIQNAFRFSNLYKPQHLPITFDDCVSKIPRELLEALTAYQIALIVNTIFNAHRDGVYEGRLMEA
jgi:hypothetical protein